MEWSSEEVGPGGVAPDAVPRAPHRILVVEDDASLRLELVATLEAWGFAPEAVGDGLAAWRRLLEGVFPLALVDWSLPGLDGIELCRRLRACQSEGDYTYLILVTGYGERLVEAMEAGADDFVGKPFEPAELRVRLLAGARVVELKAALAQRVAALERALARVHRLEGLLPICSYCKKIRDEDDAWQPVERYVTQRSGASFSHSICPTCMQEHVQPMLEEERRRGGP